GDRLVRAGRGVVLAPGPAPAVPPVPGLADVPYWTNRDAVKAETAPASLVVLGGGAVGVEIGQAFSRFGSRVTVVEAEGHLLPLEEPQAGAAGAPPPPDGGPAVRPPPHPAPAPPARP